MDNMIAFSKINGFGRELEKLKVITNKLTENGYLVDRTAQWEFAFDAVRDLVLIVNPNLEIKFINKAFADRLEVDRSAVINAYCYNTIQCPNCKKEPGYCLLEQSQKLNVETRDVYIEYPLQGWFDFTHSPIYDDGENLLGFICVLRDITEYRKMENALRKSDEKYRNIYNTAPLAFVVWDYEHKIIEWNRSAEKMFGYTKKEVEGKNFFDFIVPENAIEHVQKIVSTLKVGKDITSVNETLTKSGDVLLCEWYNSVYHDCSGKPVGFISLASDITELKEKENLIKSIFKASPAGIGLVKDRVIQWTNQRLRDMIGYSEEELLNQNARIFYPSEEEYQRVGDVKYERLRKDGFGYIKTIWQKKDGELVDILLSSAYVDDSDHSKGVTFTATDIVIWD